MRRFPRDYLERSVRRCGRCLRGPKSQRRYGIAQRRAGRAVLGALFEVREEFRISQGDAYWTEVEGGTPGKVAEGILVIRGRMTHGPLTEIRPAVKLAYPGPKFFPSNYAYPGSNLMWLDLNDMPSADRAELERRDSHGRYANHVAGRMVLPTLDVARSSTDDSHLRRPGDMPALWSHLRVLALRDGSADRFQSRRRDELDQQRRQPIRRPGSARNGSR